MKKRGLVEQHREEKRAGEMGERRADLDMAHDPEFMRGLELRFQQLDAMHRRARTPSARRRIEKDLLEIERDLRHLRSLENVVDLELEKWERDLFARVAEFKRKDG